MANVISLSERRERQAAEEHARALVLFECAAQLARQSHPGLLKIIEDVYGDTWLEERVRHTVTPRRMDGAPRRERTRRRPAH